MTVLVPGLHLLDEETYACAGLQAAFRRIGPANETGFEFAELMRDAYEGRHRALTL